jgi:drug/metabolite transporter (DMT)-like permease
MAKPDDTVREGEAPALIWWTMFAGPFAWICDLGFSYMLEQHTCSTGHHYVLHVITVVCALLALTGLAAGWAAYKRIPKGADDQGLRPMDRTHFQMLFGIVFSLAFTVVIIAEAVPRWILHPCQ